MKVARILSLYYNSHELLRNLSYFYTVHADLKKGWGEERRLANIESNKAVAFPLVELCSQTAVFFLNLQIDLGAKAR